MTAKEYLRQVYRLDNRIDSHIKELGRLREMAYSISLDLPTKSGALVKGRSQIF